MAHFRRKFDVKAYWAHKPLCTDCKVDKVKEGSVLFVIKNVKIDRLEALK